MLKIYVFAVSILSVLLCSYGYADTVTFQQGIGGYSGTTDTWLDSDDYDTNFGNDPDIHVRHDTYSVYQDRTNLLKFNVSSLPANAVITSASLSLLYYNDWSISGSDSLTISAYRLLKSWTEGTGGSGSGRTGAGFYMQYAYPNATQWYNGGARGVNQDRLTSADASAIVYDIDDEQRYPLGYAWITFTGTAIKNSVATWYANPSQNYGWVLDYSAYTDTMDEAIFHSSEYSTNPADYVWRPKLQIDYYVIPEPATLALLGLGLVFLRKR